MQRLTKLHILVVGKTKWDDPTWFQVERYLVENMTVPGMLMLVNLAGCEPAGAARSFKTHAAKLLREVPPHDVVHAWNRWRARR